MIEFRDAYFGDDTNKKQMIPIKVRIVVTFKRQIGKGA